MLSCQIITESQVESMLYVIIRAFGVSSILKWWHQLLRNANSFLGELFILRCCLEHCGQKHVVIHTNCFFPPPPPSIANKNQLCSWKKAPDLHASLHPEK